MNFIYHFADNLPAKYTITSMDEIGMKLETTGGERVAVFYFTKPITLSLLRDVFMFEGNVLVVLDIALMPPDGTARSRMPDWLRALHALYYGRVYVWCGEHIHAAHFDFDDNIAILSDPIEGFNLLCAEVDCWFTDFSGHYRIARFYDKKFWNVPNYRHVHKQTEPPAHLRRRDYLGELLKEGTLERARVYYRQLARTLHPDVNPADDATAEMQRLNEAYEKVQEIYEHA